MEKKQIWIYAEDYEKLKTFGKPGEPVADWMKRFMVNFVQMRIDLINEMAENEWRYNGGDFLEHFNDAKAVVALSLSDRMDCNAWIKNGWFDR